MLTEFQTTARELQDQGTPFVVATVVRAERPTSAKVGSKAIFTAEGILTGWVGGSCAEPTVRREARQALGDGRPRLLRLCPPEQLGHAAQEGVVEVALTCVSGGTLEIYLEPQLTQPHLVIVGHQAVAQALVTIGQALGYPCTVISPEATRDRFPDADRVLDHLDLSVIKFTPHTYVVVASHGNYDEPALEAALRSETPYVALIASQKRASAVRAQLSRAGLSEQQLGRLRSPAGLDLGGTAPEELAVSVLAEIIQFRRRSPATEPGVHIEPVREAKDPVCGMMVEIDTARYTLVHADQTYYFCSAGCKHRFATKPEAFLVRG
jgi:xanthine dehydrogenase accessory factor